MTMKNNSVLIDSESIYQINCKAIAGIGYVFRMRIYYRNPDEKRWTKSNETGNISLGFTGQYKLSDISGIQEGAEVQLYLNVVMGKDIEANESFIYSSAGTKLAYYEAWGPCFNPALSFKGLRESKLYGTWESKYLSKRYKYNEDDTFQCYGFEKGKWTEVDSGTFFFKVA